MTDELVNLLALPVTSLCCVCRICAKVIDPLSAVNLFINKKDDDLVEKINKYLPVAVNESDPFPKTACKHCADQVNKFHDLAQKCIDFQEDLHKAYEPNAIYEIDAKAELDVELEGLKNSPEVEFDIQELDYLETKFLNSVSRGSDSSNSGPPCQVCNEFLPNFKLCLQHQKTHVNTGLCVICEFKSDSEVEINVHLRKHFADNLQKNQKTIQFDQDGKTKCCLKCKKEFNSVKSAVDHCRTHRPTDVSSFNCIMCLKSVSDNQLFSHVASHFYKTEEPLTCEDCLKVFSTEKTLKHHRCTSTRKFKCSKCKMAFKSETRLRFHEDFHIHKQTYCQMCHKDFKFESRIFLHLASVHQGLRDNPFCCDMCGKTFRWMTALREHQRTHGEDRPFACGKCQARFFSKSSLTAHLPSHDDTARLHCLRCDYSTNRKQNLLKHVARLHQQVEPSQVVIRCRDCLEIFPNAAHVNLEGHHHKENENGFTLEELTVSKLFQCERCHSSFFSSSDLGVHRSLHSTMDKFLCRLCKTIFNKHDFLVRHQKTVHQGVISQYTGKFTVKMVYICEICELEWTDYTQLLNHKERGNCLERKMKGEIKIWRPSGPRLLPLKLRQLKVNKEGLFECPDCEKTYKSRRRYRLHLATHSERKTEMN